VAAPAAANAPRPSPRLADEHLPPVELADERTVASGTRRWRVPLWSVAALAIIALTVATAVGVGLVAPNGQPRLAIRKPEDAVRRYLEAKTWQERATEVFDEEAVRPLMKARYDASGLPHCDSFTVQPAEKLPRSGDWYLVTADVRFGSENDRLRYLVRGTPAGYKIDWKASVGYNAPPLKSFVALGTPASGRFRLKAKLSSYYNYDFRSAQPTHVSVELSESDPYATVHGYARRDSDLGRHLTELLADGKEHDVTVEVERVGPYGGPIQGPTVGVVTITKLVSESWLD
jgi:hypothetical protein